jgi:hypothetical protein
MYIRDKKLIPLRVKKTTWNTILINLIETKQMKKSRLCFILIAIFYSLTLSGNNASCSTLSRGGSHELQNKYEFVKPPLTFSKYPGLEFRLSEPFLSYPNMSTEANFAIALELKNNSKDDVTSMSFKVKLFDKQGKVISESLNQCGPLTFKPEKGKTIPQGYIGVYERFCSENKSFMDTFGKVEIELIEVLFAPTGVYDKPVFDPEWKTFEKFKGLEFRLSKPYLYLDDLSGKTRFAIAMEFKNGSGKPIKFLNFSQKVYDDQGLLVDREVQNHNMMYEPFSGSDPNFPARYSGVNRAFYTNEVSFFKKFQKIEYELISVEY